MKPRLLDLFCGAGGCAAGYARAGFDVVGVDVADQPRYPFSFHKADAFDFLKNHHAEFDAFHASPPCQRFSAATEMRYRENHPDLLAEIRSIFLDIGKPYVIENVPGAPMAGGAIMLCGLMFGLNVFRHRYFESSLNLLSPEHPSHNGKKIGEGYFSIAGGAGRWKSWGTVHRNVTKGTAAEWRDAMRIDWMTRKELTQAIPPAYTEYIGRQFIRSMKP